MCLFLSPQTAKKQKSPKSWRTKGLFNQLKVPTNRCLSYVVLMSNVKKNDNTIIKSEPKSYDNTPICPDLDTNDTLFNKLAQVPPTDMGVANMDVLKRRARSKFYTQKIVEGLLWIDSPLEKQYKNAMNCNSMLVQSGKRISGKYCNSRVCNVCNRIRMAKLINQYLKPLEELGELEFTTLTRKNCHKEELREVIEEMQKTRSLIFRHLKEKKKMNFSGIIKLEVTYNLEEDTYHPHFHILSNNNVGQILIEEWLNRHKPEIAFNKGQHTRKADKDSYKEIFKYATKFIIKDDKPGTLNIHTNALNNIMIALHNKRTFQTYGVLKKIDNEEEEIEDLKSQIIEDIEESYHNWRYDNELYDWINDSSFISKYEEPNKRLTNYKPPDINFQIFY